MNDNELTLEELQLIQDNLHWNDCAEVNQKLLQLNNKLKAMIDNCIDMQIDLCINSDI